MGNTGSRLKFKYGPLGDSVNLASRVQGATKSLGCPLLVTEETCNLLGENTDFLSRRVVKAKLANIEKPVNLHHVEAASSPERQRFFAESETALHELEQRRFFRALQLTEPLMDAQPSDGPVRLTVMRASKALAGEGFDPVWTVPGK
jgi:adenylate cyclase